MSHSALAFMPSIAVVDGKPTTTSNEVALHFGKQHQHVLKRIRALTADTPAEFNQSNFRLVETTDAKGEKRPAYRLTRDGFTLLAMGFTGKKALQFKLAYIDVFNRMDTQLHNADIGIDRLNQAYAIASQVAANTARAAFECMLKDNPDDWRDMRLLVSPVPGTDPSAVRVTRVADDALVLSLAQLPGYLMDAAFMVSNVQLAGLAEVCSRLVREILALDCS